MIRVKTVNNISSKLISAVHHEEQTFRNKWSDKTTNFAEIEHHEKRKKREVIVYHSHDGMERS